MIDYKTISLANQVYERIEANILEGVYAAGEALSESRLSEELGVSRTPIREALTKLESERLVGNTPAGTVVLGITTKDVSDMFEVKRRLEVTATSRAAEHISEEGITQLRDILEQQEFYAEKGNTEKVRNLDTQFHDVIYSECGSPVMQSILSPIHHKLMKYRKQSLQNSKRSIASVAEHRAIFEAIAARDRQKVEGLMLLHIEHACESIMKGSK